MMQVSKKIPFDDPQVLLGVRALYVVTNVIILGIYFYIQTKINAKKGDIPASLAQETLTHERCFIHSTLFCA